MNKRDLISEVIHNYVSEKCMIKEYRNPDDAETVRVCGDTLQQLYDRITSQGISKHEITVEIMEKIISQIRRLEQMMK